MKILAIRGRNLASLEGDFEIDFTKEPLCSAGIYAICGPTGAGKSTLLDAMCLALFARTPRTEQAKEYNVKLKDVCNEQLSQSDPRFLLRRGTASGYAEVDFMALNGSRYRSRWSVSRARDKENGRLQNPRLSLFNIDKEMEEQGTRSELQARIIELVGLTFEQFTRSVLLAQNDFSTFLKAEQGEKASLLEKLTGTELYSNISRKIYEKSARAKEAYDLIQQQIQGVELLSEEEESHKGTRLVEVEKELQRLEKARAERQTLQEAVRSAEQQIVTRQGQQKEATEKLERLVHSLAAIQQETDKGLEEQRQFEVNYKVLQQELLQARKLDIQLEAALRDLSTSEQQLKQATSRKKDAENKYQEALQQQRKEAEEITRLSAWRERYKKKETIAEQLSTLLLHLDMASDARSKMDGSNRLIVTLQKKREELKKHLSELQQTVVSKQLKIKQTEEEYRILGDQLKSFDSQSLDSQIEKVREERERLLVEQARWVSSGSIKELREKLQEGEPCPVCGSIHHPFVEKSITNKLSTAIASLTLQFQELSKQKESFGVKTRQLTELQQRLLLVQKEVAESETAYKETDNQRQLLINQLEREEISLKEQTEKLAQALSVADGLFGSSDWQSTWKLEPAAFRKTLVDFARQWHENTEILIQLEQQQSAKKAACESLASFLPNVGQLYKEAMEQAEKSRAVLVALQTERGKLLDGRPADKVEQAYTLQMEQLKERLKKLQVTQVEQTTAVEQTRGTVEQITKDLAEQTKELALRKDTFTRWNTDYLAASNGLSLDENLQQVTQEKNELNFHLRTQKENKKKIAGFQKELEKSRVESERWAKLNELVGSADGGKFRRIAQGYTLDVLLNYANVQLKELTHRYRLERVPDTLALQVIDRDMCDEIRTVHSLSGGESFLVSLALALGLSSLSSNRIKVESLFIDEGFGSLDAETLRVAMDALESLRTQGRKIGVISHVQEMTERIPVRISVNRSGNGRSYLEFI
ncbi:MAG: AAA family ATPase [Parabacteroides sp.]|nr:AAA family ATPase [Parabacteroides sp.]